jgi:hypothetical protein
VNPYYCAACGHSYLFHEGEYGCLAESEDETGAQFPCTCSEIVPGPVGDDG